MAFCTVGLDWAADPSNTAALAAISGSELSNKLGLIIWFKPPIVTKSTALSTCAEKCL